MLIYFIFIFILVLNFSFEVVGPNGEHDIIYFNEYDITKNTHNNKVTAGSHLTLIMKIEKNYDLSQLTVRFKSKGMIDHDLTMYLCSFHPNYFTKSNCENNDQSYYRINLNNDDYNIFLYYFEDRTYKNVEYLAFYPYSNSDTTLMTIFAFPLKIFNLTDSNELNINSYYPNSTIPKSTYFYIRIKQNLTEANIQFKVPYNSNNNFNLKVHGFRKILSDEEIKKNTYYDLNANLLKQYNNGAYINYIYNIKSTTEKPYILIFAEMLNTLDSLSISIYKLESAEQNDSDEKDSSKMNLPENSKDSDNDSNSSVLIIIIVILSSIILIIFGYYLFKKFKKKSQSNEIENNFNTPKNDNPMPLSTILDKYN